ncbi:MAG: malto-oligosyltrehalose trehalohydrolase [Alphaproteobacteria bacterium]
MTEIPMKTQFTHDMPFGAAMVTGGVRFRLWAPSATAIGLVIDESDPVQMPQLADGWFELTTDRAAAGTRYLFELPDGLRVPDPASRWQPQDVHGPSMVVDPAAYRWKTVGWRGQPWEETVLYELHVGTFSPEGTFEGVRKRLDHFVETGVTAVQLMPVADFPGDRNWGYDGVLHYAPDSAYGTPDDLKRLIDEAHGRGLSMFLDVVYNHFGPDGNYLNAYAAGFFDPEIETPWGSAVNYAARPVRDFVIENALYWLREYRFDGLRFDAVDEIKGLGEEHLLEELAPAIRNGVAADDPERHIHLVIENDRNQASMLAREDGRAMLYDAQWNDDIHHVYHHLATGDAEGYYADYAEHAIDRLGKALATGFVYQGETSRYRGGKTRGEASGHLPPTAFVGFIQNHDQVGNRAFGERIDLLAPPAAIEALAAVYLLAPQVPLLFMGEEWGAAQPFLFFTDFHDELADAVREGRRREFARFPLFADPVNRTAIPDPNDIATFTASRLDWGALNEETHAARHALVRSLLRLRRAQVVPLLGAAAGGCGRYETFAGNGLHVVWKLGDAELDLVANLGEAPVPAAPALGQAPDGALLYETATGLLQRLASPAGKGEALPGWSVLWRIRRR